MKRKFAFFSWIVVVVAAFIVAVAAVAQPGPPGGQQQGKPPKPPQEAITACKNKKPGSTCRITTNQGTINGTCGEIQEQLVCIPEGGPPGSSGANPPRN